MLVQGFKQQWVQVSLQHSTTIQRMPTKNLTKMHHFWTRSGPSLAVGFVYDLAHQLIFIVPAILDGFNGLSRSNRGIVSLVRIGTGKPNIQGKSESY